MARIPIIGGRKERRPCRVVLLVIGYALLTHGAIGSENYTAIVDRFAEVECPRPLTRCLICHSTAAGGEGTANKSFAMTLAELGFAEGKAGRSLALTLQSLPADSDSDEDGATDFEELNVCGNPSGLALGEGPEFGCHGSTIANTGRGISPRSQTTEWLGFYLITLAAILRWRKVRTQTLARRRRQPL